MCIKYEISMKWHYYVHATYNWSVTVDQSYLSRAVVESLSHVLQGSVAPALCLNWMNQDWGTWVRLGPLFYLHKGPVCRDTMGSDSSSISPSLPPVQPQNWGMLLRVCACLCLANENRCTLIMPYSQFIWTKIERAPREGSAVP